MDKGWDHCVRFRCCLISTPEQSRYHRLIRLDKTRRSTAICIYWRTRRREWVCISPLSHSVHLFRNIHTLAIYLLLLLLLCINCRAFLLLFISRVWKLFFKQYSIYTILFTLREKYKAQFISYIWLLIDKIYFVQFNIDSNQRNKKFFRLSQLCVFNLFHSTKIFTFNHPTYYISNQIYIW